MKLKSVLSLLLAFTLLFAAAFPAFAAAAPVRAAVEAGEEAGGAGGGIAAFFKNVFARIRFFFDRLRRFFEVRREKVRRTMNQNAIHMLKSVTDTIGDSFIITTEDGKVIVIDGGHYTETAYFIEYLKAVTGRKKPHIDAWFLSHPHDDHCEVFLDVAENHADEVTFDKVYANFPEASFYEGADEWAVAVISEYNRLLPRFADRAAALAEGDVFNVGAARFTVFYTFNPEFRGCNSASTIMRMDLGGSRVMFNGDAWTDSGDYVVEKYGDTGELRCDICKVSHHGNTGVGKNFYEAVAPEICLWPTPSWVYENVNGNLTTDETRAWADELGVKKNYKAFEGSCVIGMRPRIVTTTDVFEEGYPAETALERLAGLGFEGIDMGLDYWTFEGSPFLGDEYLDWANGLRKQAETLGVGYTHAHAPGRADDDAWVGRSIEAAAALGARYLVVHPIWSEKNGRTIKSKARFLDVNARAIKKWLPTAEACGVVLLSENVLWGASADPRAIADLVKKVDSEWFGWTFDVGHAWSCGYAPDILKKCCVTPASLHIQDNDGTGDGHLIPGDGTIDWALFIRTLGEVGYVGDCVLEAHHQSLDAPDAERDAILTRLLETAKDLRADMRR